ncbi:hypothetical protein TNCV_2916901 [Trichonephila clavipes]|nr:hypothetical protein TNCV_2916901 [Trichonephila clavipes]
MRSGDLFLEASSAKQATALINLQKLAHLDVTVAPHTNLNFSRGVISPADFLNVSTEEIKENMKAQNVCDVRRITIRRDGQVLNTKHLILTFNTPDLPQTVKMAYIRCPVRPYIPNPLRCFQCQRFGHSKTVCRGQPTCSRCAEARRVVSSRTPVSGKSYASATSKSYISTAIQVDASTAPTSATAASITPKNVAVDTLKSVSPPRDRRKSDGRSVAQTFVFWLLAGSTCEDMMTSFISWNCRGLRTRLADLKSIISTYQPACVALQETFLKSTMTMQVRGYNCVRRDVDGDTSPTGGVCLFTSNLFPSNVVTLHTSLQAVAVRIHVHSLVTVCCVYLPPNDVVPQVDLNHLVSQLPAPFILLGDFNGHSPLWGHDVTNSRGRQIEQLISDHCLCLLNNDEKTYFHAPTRTFHSLDLAICSPTLLPMLNFEVANDLHNSDHFPL